MGRSRRAHCNGIVHRDVKPGNMFVLAPQCLELLAFGIADIGDHAELTQAGAR